MKTRFKILCSALAIWTLAAMAMNFHIAVSKRPYYIEQGRKLSAHSGEYYLPRARLISPDGRILAWSEKYFELVWTADTPCPENLRTALKNILKNPSDIDAEEIVRLEPLMRRYRNLAVRSRVERKCIDDTRYHHIIGKTVFADGRLIGISGAEKEFDSVLSGKPGRYSVMLDRRGEWIYDTWQQQTEPVAGKDVTLRIP